MQYLQICIVYEVFHILFALCTESLGKSLDERGSSPRNSTMKNYLTVFNLFVIMFSMKGGIKTKWKKEELVY